MDYKHMESTSISFISSRLRNNFERYCIRCLRPHKLHIRFFHYLSYVYQNPGCSPGDVSCFFHLDNALITRRVDFLVKRGCLIRVPSREDGRSISLYVTETGKELANRLALVFTSWDTIFDGYFKEEELQQFREMLGRIFQVACKIENEELDNFPTKTRYCPFQSENEGFKAVD